MNPISILLGILVVLLFAAGVANFVALFRGCSALRSLARKSAPFDAALLLRSPLVPGISILAVPPDFSPRSRAFIRRLLDLEYGKFELVLVLNGPSEAELESWKQEFRLNLIVRCAAEDLATAGVRGVYDSVGALRLVVVDKAAAGEADALNAGVNVATFPVVAVVQEACEFDSRLLLRLVVPMLQDPVRTAAVVTGGPAAPAAGLLAQWGTLESWRAWLGRSAAFAAPRLALPVPPFAVAFHRQAVLDVGGFRAGPLELLVRLQGLVHAAEQPFRIVALAETGTSSRAVRSLAELRARIERDQAELAGLCRPRPSLPGGRRAPGWRLLALMRLRGVLPALETAAYALAVVGLAAGWVRPALAALVLLATAGVGTIVSMAAVAFGELADRRGSDPRLLAGLFLAAVPENFGYRQLRNLWLIAAQIRGPQNGPSEVRPVGKMPRHHAGNQGGS